MNPLKYKGIFYAILAAFCFGIMPILTKLIYGETGVDPFFFLMLRYTMAAIILWGFVIIRRGTTWQQVNRQNLFLILITSCCYITVTAAYFVALKYINASLNSLLVFTFPVFTPFLGYFFFREKLAPVSVVAAIIGFLGCAMVIGGYQLKGIPLETFGITLGLISGVIYALYTLFGQKITVQLEPLTVTVINITIVATFFLICRLSWLWSHPLPFKVYLVAGIIAVISTILANNFYFEAIRAVGAVKAGVFSSFEPLFTVILAIIFLGEGMAVTQWVGALCIFGAMIIIQQPWNSNLQ